MAFVGVFVPGIPTTIFLIIALWAFARSSKKFHSWLLNHRRFGPILHNWQTHKVVPRKAKILMVILQISAVIIIHYSILLLKQITKRLMCLTDSIYSRINYYFIISVVKLTKGYI